MTQAIAAACLCLAAGASFAQQPQQRPPARPQQPPRTAPAQPAPRPAQPATPATRPQTAPATPAPAAAAPAAPAAAAAAAPATPRPPAQPAPQGFDELLRQIRASGQESAKLNTEREQRFLRNRNEQAQLVQQAEAQLAAAQGRANRARARFEADQAAITELKGKLETGVGDLGQMYAAVRTSAAEFGIEAGGSLTAAQFPERAAFLQSIAGGNVLPSLKQLEDLWYYLAQDMTEGARVARFQAEVVDRLGNPQTATVVRIGPFTAFTEDAGYLTLQPGTARLQALVRQPGAHVALIGAFAGAAPNQQQPILIDPTRGHLLAAEADRPGMMERVHQGGEVGYVIIALGVLGAILAVWQFFYLSMVGGRVRRQLKDIATPRPDNPLGRVLSSIGSDAAAVDPEVLEVRLSEAVLRETPKIERFQSLLRMIVAAGPLLGLLGTVVGMIITFQVITEVGAGDPKTMAGGISQAMIATLLGLGIAIPLLFINTLLASRSRVLIQVLDEQSAGMLARQLEARGLAGAPAATVRA